MTLITPPPPIQPPLPVAHITLTREGREHDLRPEQFIQASVAETAGGKVLLDMGHQRIWAESEISFQVGQRLHLVVQETSPRLVLQLLDVPLVERISHLIHQLGGRWNLLPLLEVLTGPTSPLPAGSLGPAAWQALEGFKVALNDATLLTGGLALPALLKRLGLRLEAELAKGETGSAAESLKHALLGVREQLQGAGHERAGQVDSLLQMLELFQLCNLGLARQGGMVWPLPLPFVDNGYLLVERQPQPEGEEEPSRKLSLHLSLPALGELRVDFLHEDGGLYLRFVCASRPVADFIRQFSDELPARLGPLALRTLTVSEGVETAAQSLLGQVLGEQRGMLNTRA
jgi:hypothetical protein